MSNDEPQPLTVYIIEDSPIILRLLSGAAEAAGADVVGQSDNAENAIRELSQLTPDLILIDIALRSGTGFDVLEALQAGHHASAAAKVVFTNHATAEHRDRSFQLGATRFFDKASEGWQALEMIAKMAADKRGAGVASRVRGPGGEPNNHGKH